jgi:hypothetical protein
MAAPAAKPDDIQACLQETKALLEGLTERTGDQRLRTCIGNIDKIAALLQGDYEAVWRIEAEQRRQDIAFKDRVMENLRMIQCERLQAAKCGKDDTPLLAALRAMAAIRCPPASPPLPPVPPCPTYTEDDEDLYR